MTGMSPGRLRIGRLVARGIGRDGLRARLRVESSLGLVDLRHVGLPPDAILCVRRLADPAPGTFPARRAGVPPPAAWLMAVERRLEHLARQAARPALEPVPDSAEAVLFADRAELLAALAAAWAAGGTLDRWWWRRLLPASQPREIVVGAWREEADAVPAALEHLVRGATLAPFLTRLGADDAVRVTEALLRTYGLPEPAQDQIPATSPAAQAGSPPWADVAPETAHLAVPPPAVTLAGIGLTLARRPAMARAAAFTTARDAWLRRAAAAPETPTSSARLSPRPAAPEPPPAPAPAAHPPPRAGTTAPRGVQGHVPGETSAPGARKPAFDIAEPATGGRQPAPERGGPLAGGAAHDPPAAPRPDPVAFAGPPAPVDWAREAAWPALVPRRILHTEYGGILFLANVALAIGLYADFTRPADPGLPMEFWALILGLAARLLGDAPVDPLWTALGDIAGDEADQPPPEPGAWRIPPAWIGPDAERDGWAGWWSAAVPYIRDRLARALTPPAGLDPAVLLLRQPARVEMTDTSIHALFALERHPIEIRLAGLDRDPGWIPAAGRSITFGFDLTTA